MGVSGAALGPILDGFHSRFGVLRYHNPPPFPVMLGNFELCQTAAWVPPLFGLAGIIIGTLYVLLDQVFSTPDTKRDPDIGVVVVGILCFVLQYFLSGILLGPLGFFGAEPAWWAPVFLWVTAMAHWRLFDGTRAGFLVSALTAIGGPAIEVGLLNAPGLDVYAYASGDLFGFPTWAIAVYFCGGPAVGNLARAVFRRMEARNAKQM